MSFPILKLTIHNTHCLIIRFMLRDILKRETQNTNLITFRVNSIIRIDINITDVHQYYRYSWRTSLISCKKRAGSIIKPRRALVLMGHSCRNLPYRTISLFHTDLLIAEILIPYMIILQDHHCNTIRFEESRLAIKYLTILGVTEFNKKHSENSFSFSDSHERTLAFKNREKKDYATMAYSPPTKGQVDDVLQGQNPPLGGCMPHLAFLHQLNLIMIISPPTYQFESLMPELYKKHSKNSISFEIVKKRH